jgi:predicted acylesterase/phospholipase RssA
MRKIGIALGGGKAFSLSISTVVTVLSLAIIEPNTIVKSGK